MINVALIDPVSNCSVEIQKGLNGRCTLIAESLKTLQSRWKTEINTGIETVDVVTPLPGASILITDVVISSSKKVASSTVVVQFSDGVNTEVLLSFENASAPMQFAHAPSALTGWKDAILQVITDQAAMNITTFIGYLKIAESLTKSYSVWNSER